MCGIAGFVSLSYQSVPNAHAQLNAMSKLISHRGPDGHGFWISDDLSVGFAHRRLSIIDLSDAASQPMASPTGTTITFNGEIYNYRDLQIQSKIFGYPFRSSSDTETILAQYAEHKLNVVSRLRGMFAFAIWDSQSKDFLIARDRFGIKPLYYCVVNGIFYFASEIKALLPFLEEIETDASALAEYLTFQYTLTDQTMFSGVKQLMPGHYLVIRNGIITIERYWDVIYQVDYDHDENYFIDNVKALLNESIDSHLRSDVEIGSYLSGGLDSSIIASVASSYSGKKFKGFHGRFNGYPDYDESNFAKLANESYGGELYTLDITSSDFVENIKKVIYHLDHPVAGPGSFPQFMVSKLASTQVKVVLGGQGGDEIFGGYARYLLAYFEQTIKAAIEGTYKNGNFVVTIESIIPNLVLLREYIPLIKQFWSEDLFGPLDRRFLRLIDRSVDMKSEINWEDLNQSRVYENFYQIFNSRSNVTQEAYFDKMTHFEFKTLLPALLQVEDRMSMAHGIESRVPFLDHKLVEFAATIPADIKFKNGELKYLLKAAFKDQAPKQILNRNDKMGFPVPLTEWFSGELKDFVMEILENTREANRKYVNVDVALKQFSETGKFSRKIWALINLEIWQQQFHDKSSDFKKLVQ